MKHLSFQIAPKPPGSPLWLGRTTFLAKKKVALDPSDVDLFDPVAVVFHADLNHDLVE